MKVRALSTLLATAAIAACSPEQSSSGVEATAEATDTAEQPASAASEQPAQSADALVPGTKYNATTTLSCGIAGAAPTELCSAGVIRNWGEDGGALVEVTKPDGSKRSIFFKGTTPTGADGSQADGSAGWDFSSKRNGDEVTINFGPETYVVVDALVEGG